MLYRYIKGGSSLSEDKNINQIVLVLKQKNIVADLCEVHKKARLAINQPGFYLICSLIVTFHFFGYPEIPIAKGNIELGISFFDQAIVSSTTLTNFYGCMNTQPA